MKRSSVAVVAILLTSGWLSSSAVAATITDVTPAHASTKGGKTLTINGVAFSASGNSVSIGGRDCPVTAESSTQIECTAPDGSGAFKPLSVLDGTGTASPPFAFGFDAPEVTDVTPAAADTRGGTLITLTGSNFGPNGISRSVSVGGVDCPIVPGLPGASTHDQIVCTVPPGEGANHSIIVTAEGQEIDTGSTRPSLAYRPPSATTVTPTHGAAIGGTPLTIYGDQFGLHSTVSVGGNDCPVAVQSQSQLECTLPPGSGSNLDVIVSAGGQASNALPFSYGTPASKCDAAKSTASGNFAKCLAGVQAKAAKKGTGGDAAAIAKCEQKIDDACRKAESTAGDCSQLGTCHVQRQSTVGWDAAIYGSVR